MKIQTKWIIHPVTPDNILKLADVVFLYVEELYRVLFSCQKNFNLLDDAVR